MAKLARIRRNSFIYGVTTSLLIIVLYLLIVSFFQGINYAVSRFIELWYFMFPLVIGFGFQIGLLVYIRNFMKMSSGTAGMSGSVSTVSMVACCAHHITDVIPILGISTIGIFLLEYQPIFLAIGIVSNLIGIMYVLNVARKGRAKFGNSILQSMMKYDYGRLIKISLGVGVIVLATIIIFLGYQWYQNYYGEKYSRAVSSELSDKCAAPSGYTDEAWKEHMSHHPDRYGECLGG